ncbi:MAG: hypothetical protein M0Z59_09765 [Nitrospiraceae bacterium]|nr:hypothetical protein [Nitrospiraceae bacterium]
MRTRISKKLMLIGAGAGIVGFAVFGLLPGSFLGGVMGLNIAGSIFGYPVTSDLLPRIIVAASMLVGVMVSGIIFVVGGSFIGWLLGTAIEAVAAPKAEAEKEETGA